MVIYKIQNLKTGDVYVGSAIRYNYRKWSHLHKLRRGMHHSPILQNSWNKHGEDAFTFEVIETVETKEKLIEREQHYIDALNPRYNICKIAGSPLGVKHTYESRTNMSLAHKGLPISENAKRHWFKKGHTVRKGKEISIEHRKKVSKPVLQYTLDGKFVREWYGATAAAKELNLNAAHISACCLNKRNKHGNFIWKFKT